MIRFKLQIFQIICFKYLSIFFALLVLILACKHSSSGIENSALEKSIESAATYLNGQVKENGMFVYRINMDPNVRVNTKYNILRHAGTIYSLCMYHKFNPDQKIKSTIEKTGSYLLNEAIDEVPNQDSLLAVWSKPEVNHASSQLQAKLGGTGIGLVALVSIEEIIPGFTPISDLQALGRFLVFMQKDDGDFYSKYYPDAGGRNDSWRSLYYPGEAALGLVLLYEKDNSDIWIHTAAKALGYLANVRKNLKTVPADHWALLATAKLLSIDYKGELPVSREVLVNHAVQICQSILRSQVSNSANEKFLGGFTTDGRTTPSATRLEGLLAALTFIPKNHKLYSDIEYAVQQGISFLQRAQVTEGTYTGAFPRAVDKMDPKLKTASNFNRRALEVRIDYVQHALSAFIQYKDWLEQN
jgi:hypothetical protein